MRQFFKQLATSTLIGGGVSYGLLALLLGPETPLYTAILLIVPFGIGAVLACLQHRTLTWWTLAVPILLLLRWLLVYCDFARDYSGYGAAVGRLIGPCVSECLYQVILTIPTLSSIGYASCALALLVARQTRFSKILEGSHQG